MAQPRSRGARSDGGETIVAPAAVSVDLHRAFVFPNRMREQRHQRGYPKLLRLAAAIPGIPYIRLSKIERGEVVARAGELRQIAAALGISPLDLLIDVDAPGFDIAHWAEPFRDDAPADLAEERFAVLLGAALRARRTADPELTIAAIERVHGLPPVNLSRIENAHRPFERWNAATQRALFSLFEVAGERELRAHVARRHAEGALDAFLPEIGNPALRSERTSARVRELRTALEESGVAPAAAPLPPAPAPASAPKGARLVPVFGAALASGAIADVDTGLMVEAPSIAGPRSFGLRVCRATLGGGLPGQATVVVDPDHYPVPGGIAALREAEGWRLLAVAAGRDGRMIGYSINPDHEVALDACDPAQLAAVVSAILV